MSVCYLGSKETRKIIAQRLTKMKIDIATIQETHHMSNGEWGGGNYTFYTTAARKNDLETGKKNHQREENQNGIG